MNKSALRLLMTGGLLMLVLILAAPIGFVVAMFAQSFELGAWVLLIIPALAVAVYLVLSRKGDQAEP